MAARKQFRSSNSLIDWIRPTEADGPLLGAVFATYGLGLENPDFFGQDFLPTLLGLGGVRDRGYASPVTLERTLSTVDTTLICDAHGVAAGARPTLRIDVLPIGYKVHHAKIVLIHRHNRVRLIVGSANLTHAGFRQSREIATVLDFHPDSRLPVEILEQALGRWIEVLGDTVDDSLRNNLAAVVERVRSWSLSSPRKGDGLPQVVFGGGPVPLWQQLVNVWPPGEPLERWCICSPFWPQSQGRVGTTPFEAIADSLVAKGVSLADCHLDIITRADSPSDRALPRFPFALIRYLRERGFAVQQGQILPAQLEVADEEIPSGMAAENRDLHAKWIVLAGPSTVVAMVGSANFTRQGLGVLSEPRSANIEACVLWQSTRDRWDLDAWRPPIRGQIVDWATCTVADVVDPPVEEAKAEDWPEFVQKVELAIHWAHLPDPDGELRIHFRPGPETSFRVEWPIAGSPDHEGVECTSGLGDPLCIKITSVCVRALLVRRAIHVCWNDSSRMAWFPINILQECKPGMPSVLGAKPSEEQLLAYFHGRITEEDLLIRLEQQAQAAIDHTTIALQENAERLRQLQNYVLREFVESLYGLSRTLQDSAFSPRAAEQALLGDLSPVSLAEQVVQAFLAGRRSPTAAAYQLAELVRVVGELEWSIESERAGEARSALESVRSRAMDRLFGLVATALANPSFAAVAEDREFAAFLRTLLPPGLAARWIAPFPTHIPEVTASKGAPL